MLLARKKLTLDECIEECRSAQDTSQRVEVMRRGAEEKGLREARGSADNVFVIRQRSDTCGIATEERDAPTDQVRRVCQYCGKGHQWGAEHCPAFGKRCSRCMGRNHFAKVCKKKVMRAHEVLSEEVLHKQTKHSGALHTGPH